MKVGGAIMAGLGALFGLVWIFTSAASNGCTFTGQLEGQSCIPASSDLHGVSGPAAIVLLLIGMVLFIIGASQPRR